MGFSDNEGKPGNFAEQYNSRREHHLSSLQQKEEEMRQKFVIRVKEKEAELKEAEKEVKKNERPNYFPWFFKKIPAKIICPIVSKQPTIMIYLQCETIVNLYCQICIIFFSLT